MSFFFDFKELDRYGVKCNTNKASSWINPKGEIVNKVSLLDRYEFFLRIIKDKFPLALLELGAGPDGNLGASMRCWKEYFRDTTDLNVADIKTISEKLSTEGFKVHVGDLGDVAFLKELASKPWDFILDDASHIWSHQILSFRNLFPALKSGGIFIMEDLCTSFGSFRNEYNKFNSEKDACLYFLALSRVVCGGSFDTDIEHIKNIFDINRSDYSLAKQIDMISWMGNSCIIVKK